MKFSDRIKPKNKSGVLNYVALALILVQQILTFCKSLSFEAYDRFAKAMVTVETSLQKYIWFPTTGSGKLNLKLTEQIAKELPHAKSAINSATLFPVLMFVATIALLLVYLFFGSNKGATAVTAIWSVLGILASFVNNVLFGLQSTYTVQMVLIFAVAALALCSIVLRVVEKK